MDKVELHTERLILAAPTLADVDAIADACQDPELQRRVPIPVPYTVREAEEYVTTFSDLGWATGMRCTWAIYVAADFVGVIGLDGIADGAAEIGYWMAPAFRGRGFLTEAAQVVVDFGFADPSGLSSSTRPSHSASSPAGLGLQRIQWRAYADNVASAIVAQRVGFQLEGVHRLGAMGRTGREDDWVAGMLATDSRHPWPWSVLS